MSVCCDSHIRGGIAVQAVTLTVNAAAGSALISRSGGAGQRNSTDARRKSAYAISSHRNCYHRATDAAVRLAGTWWDALRIVEQAGNLGPYAFAGFLTGVDIAIGWGCTVTERY